MEISPVSLRLWKSSGRISFHSIAVAILEEDTTPRWAANLSHKMKMNIISAINERRDPKEDTTFHFINASG